MGTLRFLRAPLQLHGPSDGVRQYRMRVDADVGAQGLRLHASLPAQAGRPDRLQANLQTRHRRLDPLRWRALFDDLSGRVQLQWRLGSLRWINPLLSEPRCWARGAARAGCRRRLVTAAVGGSRAEVGMRRARGILDSVP